MTVPGVGQGRPRPFALLLAAFRRDRTLVRARPGGEGEHRRRMGWTFVSLMLILKIPIAALLGIVWWAIRSTPETQSEPESTGGGGGAKTRPRHPRKPLPHHPR